MENKFKELIEKIRSYSPQADIDGITRAYEFAKKAHEGQQRKSGEPYVYHPLEVATIIADMELDSDAIIAGLLHDTVEDVDWCTVDTVKEYFGENVAALVDGVTKLEKIQYTTREEQQIENLRKMLLAMAKDIRVILIKLADRLHNMRTMKSMAEARRRSIARETIEVYAPLAHRLGMSKIKWELEDLSLKYLDPIAYQEISESINQKKQEREQYISTLIDSIQEKVKSVGIDAHIAGRAKHFYSIYRKMYTQNKYIDEIYDLFAVRIIVNSISECYSVLGVVHELYKPIPLRFKDYIAMPKPNMYQSLHSTVIGPSGTPFEVQIRTWEMHKVAEQGIAAHWKYKQGVIGNSELDGKLEWVRQLLDMQKELIDADDFMQTLKIDLFADEVFVFTPKGDVINLPAGSNPIDFAFTIHSAIGCKMMGAKVNGKIVPIDYTLKNGDIIEILTSPNVHGPSRDWLKIVKTSQARNKMNQWFKRERRDENVERGKDLIEKELRRIHLTYNELFREQWVSLILKRYSFANMEDLYAGIGYGGISAQKIVMRLRDEYAKFQIAEKSEQEIIDEQQLMADSISKAKKHSNGISVVGIDNCLVRLSRCCNPVPGDRIVGFITRGRGVSVHREDCPNMNMDVLSTEDKARFISVNWEEAPDVSYNADFIVECSDKPGTLVKIISLINEQHVPIRSINARSKKTSLIIDLSVGISSLEQVDKLMKKLKTIPDVHTVNRNNT